MLLSELLHAKVVDADGQDLGHIVDVRLVQDGPLLQGFGAALRVEGVVVGPGGVGTRLGFYRGGIKGPWLLKWLFHRRERKAAYVEWPDVAEWDLEAGRVKLRISAEEARLDRGAPPPESRRAHPPNPETSPRS